MKKVIALAIMLLMVLSVSVAAYAMQETTAVNNTIQIEPVVKVNPLYKDIESEENFIFSTDKTAPVMGLTYHTTFANAGAEARGYLKNRASSFTVGYRTSNFDQSQEAFDYICDSIITEAMKHTGTSNEGDYIMWHWGRYGAGASYWLQNGYYYFDITFEFEYYTTASQEAAVTSKLKNVYNQLNLSGKDDYQKIYAIYDYICDNVTYDYDHLNNENYKLQFTAYAALINGTSVCQGYANLFYRMALDFGVDSRVIVGDAGGPHAWNIVQMENGYYYNLDSTWDAGQSTYTWFLKCPNNFPRHYRDYDYTTSAFNSAYPMGSSDYVYGGGSTTWPVSGYCGGEGNGQNLEWVLDKNGVLTISGTGKMANYGNKNAGWNDYSDKVKTLVLEEGITSIGECAFINLPNLSGELVIPDTVVTIGSAAFGGCSGFTGSLIIPDSVVTINRGAFDNCSGFDGNLVLSNNLSLIDELAFNGCTGFTGNLVIPDSVTELGIKAFYNCSGFNGSLTIGKGIDKIPMYAFCKTGFNGEIVIQKNITDIEDYAFWNCGINSYYFEGNAPWVGFESFDVSADTIYYPSGNDTWEIVDGKWNGYNAVVYGEPEATLMISEGKVFYGKECKISVSLSDKTLATAIQFAIKYDKTVLKLVSASAGSITEDATINTGEDGIIYFGWDNPTPLSKEGVILELVFTVFDSAEPGDYSVEIDTTKNFVFSKSNLSDIVMDVENGKVTLIEGECGDLTGDDKVDIRDAYYARLVAARLIAPTEEQLLIGDVDGDGKITAIDANILRKFAVYIIKELPVVIEQ